MADATIPIGWLLPISATAWHEGVLQVRLAGARAAVAAACSRLGGELVPAEQAMRWWRSVRDQTQEFFQPDEQDYRALFFGELGDCAFQVTQLEPLALLRRTPQQRLAVVQSDGGAFPNSASDMVNILVVQDGEQPRSKI